MPQNKYCYYIITSGIYTLLHYTLIIVSDQMLDFKQNNLRAYLQIRPKMGH